MIALGGEGGGDRAVADREVVSVGRGKVGFLGVCLLKDFYAGRPPQLVLFGLCFKVSGPRAQGRRAEEERERARKLKVTVGQVRE